jgi:hypothetical protein
MKCNTLQGLQQLQTAKLFPDGANKGTKYFRREPME